jgi:hypothetical protein
MSESAAAASDGRLTSDRARELVKRRWQKDNTGLSACIDRLDKRRDALTGDQLDRLDEITWARRAAAGLPAFDSSEIAAAGRAAARIDARLTRQAGGDRATT